MNTALEKTIRELRASAENRVVASTKEALVKAFKDDGIHDLEGIIEHILDRVTKDLDIERTEPRLVDYSLLRKRTSDKVLRGITHVPPLVHFVVDGVTYDPKDIRRFDGEALISVPVVDATGRCHLQVFHEEIQEFLANYFQARQLSLLLSPAEFPIPGLPPPTPPGTQPPAGYPPLVGCGYPGLPPCGQSGQSQQPPGPTPPPREPNPPYTGDQIQMFDDADYGGNWLWLTRGFMWNDLTRVSRGGLFGGNWSDEISSLSWVSTSCIYCEHVNLEGSKLLVGPKTAKHNLSIFGWNDRISSVWNFDS